jgi:hypothetical protein
MRTPRSHSSLVIPGFALALFLAACGGSVDSSGQGTGGAAGSSGSGGSGGSGGGCDYGGQHHAPGESFPAGDGCNTCSCGFDGSVGCTLAYCMGGCDYQGQHYEAGASFPAGDGCNSCTCDASGMVMCTEMACQGGCLYNGEWHPYGSSFPAGDGCNSCMCDSTGQVACTGAYCPVTCTYAGTKYKLGESFPALDGCNKCTCTDQGTSCTDMACPCDPSKEWWRDYVSMSPQQCMVIDYACPVNTTGFQNNCGCGCEQDPSCPEYFDCMPPAPCDPKALQEKCPYSGIAW